MLVSIKHFAYISQNTDEVTNKNLTSFKEEANAVIVHASALLKNLLIDSQNKLSQLNNSANKASIDMDSSAQTLLSDITEHANEIEKDINSAYENITTLHFKNADDRLSQFADELSALHDTTTEQLIAVTDELSDDLNNRSKQLQEGLGDRCNDVINRVNNLFSSFQEKLNERLQFSRGQKQALETDKHKILLAVQNELFSIQKSFAKKNC